jgi:acetyl-CoA acetyltransferase
LARAPETGSDVHREQHRAVLETAARLICEKGYEAPPDRESYASSTFSGLKARGHPVGASGAYQIVEATTQLRREAGPSQVPGARMALTQSIGGHGSIAVTHVLEV